MTPEPGGSPLRTTPEALGAVATRAEGPDGAFTLEVEAWRSYQPTMERPPGDPMIAILRLRVEGERAIPGALSVDSVWLVRGADVERAQAREEQPRVAGAGMVEFVIRDGPRWPTGETMDVVVALGGLGGAPLLVRAPRVVIARVD